MLQELQSKSPKDRQIQCNYIQQYLYAAFLESNLKSTLKKFQFDKTRKSRHQLDKSPSGFFYILDKYFSEILKKITFENNF